MVWWSSHIQVLGQKISQITLNLSTCVWYIRWLCMQIGPLVSKSSLKKERTITFWLDCSLRFIETGVMMHRQHTYRDLWLHYCEITSGLCPGCVSPCSGSAPAVQTPSICLSSRTPRSAAPHPLLGWAHSLKNSITCFESLHNLILHIHADRKPCTTDKLGVS